jgi:endo-1,4-beta-mannosidase
MNFDFESWKKQLREYLYNQIKSKTISYETFKDVINTYGELGSELQQILEYAYKNAKGREKDNIYKLYKNFSYQNASSMVNKLNKLGYALKEDNNYKDVVSALEDQAYRIIEKTRHAQRSEVQYMIFRIFITNKKEIPPLLSKAFNPIYSDELFKTFIYSFLSGIFRKSRRRR